MILVVLPNLAVAQDKAPRPISVKAVSPHFAGDLHTVYFPAKPLPKDDVAYQGKWVELNLNKYNISYEKKALIHKTLTFYAQPSERSRKVGMAKVPSGINEALLFFYGDGKKKVYKVHVINDKAIPQGSFYITNISPKKIYFDVGGIKKVVKSGSSASFSPKPGSNKVSIYESLGGKPKLKIHTKWYMDEKLREFIFYYGQPLKWAHVLDNSVRSKVAKTQ